jgi:hypothetical protein
VSGVTVPSREPQDGLQLRVTDDERAAAASVADAAVADGRLTWTEHAERYEQIWAARTRAELAPTIADLGRPEPVEVPRPQRVLAVFSKVNRTPSVGSGHLHARALFGAVILDLTGMRPGDEVHVRASSWFGKVAIRVADDATVTDDGTVLLGKRAIRGPGGGPAGGPVVRITGRSAFGNLKVFRTSDGEWGPEFPHVPPGARHLHLHADRHVHVHADRHVHLPGPGHHGHHGHHGHGRKRRKHHGWDGHGSW